MLNIPSGWTNNQMSFLTGENVHDRNITQVAACVLAQVPQKVLEFALGEHHGKDLCENILASKLLQSLIGFYSGLHIN